MVVSAEGVAAACRLKKKQSMLSFCLCLLAAATELGRSEEITALENN